MEVYKYLVSWYFMESYTDEQGRKTPRRSSQSGLLTIVTQTSIHTKSPPKNKFRRDQEKWLQLVGTVLSHAAREILCKGRWLNDKHINYAQSLLKKQFPHLDEWKNTLLLYKKQEKIKRSTIIHSQGYLSMVALNVGNSECEIELFDSTQ